MLKFRGSDIDKSWAGQGDVEVIGLFAWKEARGRIVEVSEAAHTVRMAGSAPPPPTQRHPDACYWIENAPNGLDRPGEWRLDRKSGVVSYWPLPTEDLTQEEVIAPVLEQLVLLRGVKRIVFRGLDFRHTEWKLGPNGYSAMQAATEVPSALEASGAEDVSIEHCQFTGLGGHAIWFRKGSKRNRIVANRIVNIGAGAVRIGESFRGNKLPRGFQPPSEAEQVKDNVITDNEIHGCRMKLPLERLAECVSIGPHRYAMEWLRKAGFGSLLSFRARPAA